MKADARGYFGEFGGAFVPEMLRPNLEELRTEYPRIVSSPEFLAEFDRLLRTYAGRPTPLYHAARLSEVIGRRVLLKREDLLHTGAHKINNTLGQGLLAKYLGKTRIIAETGAGQHGVATASVCALLGLPCVVYMGERDIARQAPNVLRMKMLGAEVRAATSGSRTLKDATNEALRDWITSAETTHYIIGSVVGPHPYPEMVAHFHNVTSREMREQLQSEFGLENPDSVIACVGGGSNAIGAFAHFLDQPSVQLIGVEAAGRGVDTDQTAATITLGTPGVLHGSRTQLLQTADGQVQEAHSISAGLDYPGIGPQHAHLAATGRVKYVSITDAQAIEAAQQLCQLEGIIPALESAHALAALTHALPDGETHIVNLSGRGDKDLGTYMEVLGG